MLVIRIVASLTQFKIGVQFDLISKTIKYIEEETEEPYAPPPHP